MTSTRSSQVSLAPSGVRRLGYFVTIALSVGLLYVANNLLDWDAAPFITEDYERILPVLNAAFIAAIVVNVIWILYDAAWIRSLGRIILNLIAIGAMVLTLNVFPFNFAAYTFNWQALVTFLLLVVILGLVVATIAEMVKLGGLFVDG